MGRSQRQAGMLAERVHGLHQALAKTRFADHQRPVMILQGSGHDLGGAGGVTIYQHHHGVLLAVVAVHGVVALLWHHSPVLINNQLAFGEKVVGNRHRLIEQASRIAAQIRG